MTEPTIEGLQELTRLFQQMETKSGRRIVKAALRAAVTEIGKEMRRELSPKVKEARRSIRGIVKGSKRVTAKVGVHVGKGRDAQPAKKRTPSTGVVLALVHAMCTGGFWAQRSVSEAASVKADLRVQGSRWFQPGECLHSRPGWHRWHFAARLAGFRR